MRFRMCLAFLPFILHDFQRKSTISIICPRLQYMIFRKLRCIWSVTNVYFRFFRVFHILTMFYGCGVSVHSVDSRRRCAKTERQMGLRQGKRSFWSFFRYLDSSILSRFSASRSRNPTQCIFWLQNDENNLNLNETVFWKPQKF